MLSLVQSRRENNKLCGDLNLKWDQSFKLLGVSFDGLLENVQVNYDEKVAEIRKIMGTWTYRFVSPIGRACIAKTLLLSKLSHLAFSIPSISKTKLKSLESEIYAFIWKGKEKVARVDAKQPESRGGLDIPDIYPVGVPLNFHGLEERRIAMLHGNIY